MQCISIVFNIQEKLETVSVQNFKRETRRTLGNEKVAGRVVLIQRPNFLYAESTALLITLNGCKFEVRINKSTLLISHSFELSSRDENFVV